MLVDAESRMGEYVMTRVDYLKGRATVLRRVAKTIDVRSIQDRVLALAEECMQLAKLVERETRKEPRGSLVLASRVRSRPRPKQTRPT